MNFIKLSKFRIFYHPLEHFFGFYDPKTMKFAAKEPLEILESIGSQISAYMLCYT